MRRYEMSTKNEKDTKCLIVVGNQLKTVCPSHLEFAFEEKVSFSDFKKIQKN